MRPYLVDDVVSDDGTPILDNEPAVERRAVSAEVAETVTEMLETVVEPGGTAPRARVEGIAVAGKTGTAQKAEGGGYSKDRWVASFAGYLPADDPRLVIVVIIDEPEKSHFGGVVAAPVFRRIAEASVDHLHIHRRPAAVPPLRIEEARRGLAAAEAPASASPMGRSGNMPDLRGLSLRAAVGAMRGCQCEIEVQGQGYVRSQLPAPGIPVAASGRVRLELAALP
jgi:cell division protein FtsI (penicillin-binding protein 3)